MSVPPLLRWLQRQWAQLQFLTGYSIHRPHLESFEQGEIVDEPEADLGENVGGADQDIYSGDLQTFENSGPVFHQFRRKSIIPVDETVLDELSRHRSLEEVLDMQRSSSSNENE